MIYIEDKINGNLLIDYIDDGEEVIKIKPQDYIGIKYLANIDAMNMICVEVYSRIPKKSLSPTVKGKIGEYIGALYLNLDREDPEDIHIIVNETYDIESNLRDLKYDVKAGFEDKNGNSVATSFKHFLSTNRPGRNGVQITTKKYKKNYHEEGIDFVLCTDFYNDPYVEPNIYLIPTLTDEIKNCETINIASSGNTKYAKYKVDLSNLIVPRNRPEDDK